MSVQQRVWEQDRAGQQTGQVIVGPWPGIEEILEESEPAVMINRRELAAAGPVTAGPVTAGAGSAGVLSPAALPRRAPAVRQGRIDEDLGWNVVMAAVLSLMALATAVGLWQLFQVSGGLAG